MLSEAEEDKLVSLMTFPHEGHWLQLLYRYSISGQMFLTANPGSDQRFCKHSSTVVLVAACRAKCKKYGQAEVLEATLQQLEQPLDVHEAPGNGASGLDRALHADAAAEADTADRPGDPHAGACA